MRKNFAISNGILILFLLFSYTVFPQSTASPQLSKFQIEAPQLDTIKTIWLYLPKDYSEEKKFPVLYMQDAQNLFDNETAYAGEWAVDEFLDTQNAEVIVVAIEHGNDKRISELTPFPNEKYGGGNGDRYVDFIRETLKPHIDASYSTKTASRDTYIMGSSLGGLISFYAALKYPEVFGNAGVFSPSFWFSEKIYEFAQQSQISAKSKFYFMAGDSESQDMLPDMHRMIELLKEKGVEARQLKWITHKNGKHQEATWKAEFPAAYYWLLQNDDHGKD